MGWVWVLLGFDLDSDSTVALKLARMSCITLDCSDGMSVTPIWAWHPASLGLMGSRGHLTAVAAHAAVGPASPPKMSTTRPPCGGSRLSKGHTARPIRCILALLLALVLRCPYKDHAALLSCSSRPRTLMGSACYQPCSP